MAFDKNKKYGETINRKGVQYVQNGKFYNRQFKEVTLDGELVEKKKAPVKRKTTKKG